MYYTTLRLIQRERKRRGSNAANNRLLYLSTLFLVSATVHMAVQGVFGEEMWIVNADYQGGMDAYLEDFASVWYQTFGTAASIVLNLLSDGLLVRLWFHSFLAGDNPQGG